MEQKGFRQGLEQGIRQGIMPGFEQGIRKGMSHIILRLLFLKFGTVPDEVSQAISNVSDVSVLETIADQLLLAKSCKDIMVLLPKNKS